MKYFFYSAIIVIVIVLLFGCEPYSTAHASPTQRGEQLGSSIYEFTHKGTRCIFIKHGRGGGLSCDWANASPW